MITQYLQQILGYHVEFLKLLQTHREVSSLADCFKKCMIKLLLNQCFYIILRTGNCLALGHDLESNILPSGSSTQSLSK